MSEETNEKTAPAFKLEGKKFIRIEDGKEIAHLHNDGEINGLHHTQEKFREELEALVPVDVPVEEAAKKLKPIVKPSPTKVKVLSFEEEATRFKALAKENGFNVRISSKSQEDPKDQFLVDDKTPRSLFKPMTGDLTPEVVEWRRENWTPEQFVAIYEGRL